MLDRAATDVPLGVEQLALEGLSRCLPVFIDLLGGGQLSVRSTRELPLRYVTGPMIRRARPDLDDERQQGARDVARVARP